MDNYSLQSLIGSHVLELNFVRRHPKAGWMDIRGMFGTTNPKLLNGPFGKEVLAFVPPKGVGMGYDYKSKGLCVIWDIFRQEYRVFGAEQVDIIQNLPLKTEEDFEFFEQYMYDKILTLSEDDKLKFMGYIGMPTSPASIQKPMSVQPTDNKQKQTPITQKPQVVPRGISAKFKGFFQRVGDFFKRKFKRK